MAKKIVKKNTKKSITVSENCFGENLVKKTTRKCVGNYTKESPTCRSCVNRDSNMDLALICLCKSGYGKVKKTKLSKSVQVSKDERAQLVKHVISLIESGKKAKEISEISEISDKFKKETTCKSFVSSINCVYNNWKKVDKGTEPKKKGLVYNYLYYLKNGGTKPVGDSSSIRYCILVHNACK